MAFLPKIKIFPDQQDRAVKKLEPLLAKVNGYEAELKRLSDSELKGKTEEFKEDLAEGLELDDILPEAFAAAREAARRTLTQRHYDVQVVGGIVLHQGKIAQMRTGEGKTLAATLPVYLNALGGEGVHVVTVNDYLARRDAVWMGQVYHALGCSVGVITHDQTYVYDPTYQARTGADEGSQRDEERDETGSFRIEESYLRPVPRREAYAADITYGTNNEFGFDYLRDNLASRKENKVQRGFHFAIIDEVDSILIDEARTPLIISAPDEESNDLYPRFARIVPQLNEETDYVVELKLRAVNITEAGIEKVERALGIENIYDPAQGGGIRYVHNLEQALKARVLFERDKDYVVKDGEVIIVDEFTGRMMPGRRYSEGLHQAIEAKEGVEVQRESRTVASITFQNYFRLYHKLAGMTGTAVTSSEEFDKVYKLEVMVIPTNKPAIRHDLADLVLRTEEGKFRALVQDVKARHEKGQPVLIGTTSIERNEYLDKLLVKEGIAHEILNAKNHAREAEIIAQAGRPGAVTIATNMAGRGVDIILGGNPTSQEEARRVREAGGLYVVGTERHEARRIDDQLRGRAGRQGDSGSTRFYLSLEDKLMKVFGGDRIQRLMSTLKIPEDEPIESKLVSGAIEGAQKKIEGMNFDSRKHLLDYDEVLNKQRMAVYRKRDEILEASEETITEIIGEYVAGYVAQLLGAHVDMGEEGEGGTAALIRDLQLVAPLDEGVEEHIREIANNDDEVADVRGALAEYIQEEFQKALATKREQLGNEQFANVARWVILRTVDTLWMDHLDGMEYMRSSVRLRAYAQRDPLVEYKNEGVKMFNEMLASMEAQVATTILKVEVRAQEPNGSHEGPHLHMRHPSATEAMADREGAATSGNDLSAGGSAQAGSPPSATAARIAAGASSHNASRPASAKATVGRNDPCWCGSGKKFKKCHGK